MYHFKIQLFIVLPLNLYIPIEQVLIFVFSGEGGGHVYKFYNLTKWRSASLAPQKPCIEKLPDHSPV